MCFLRENREVFNLSENMQKYGVDIGSIIYIPVLDPHNPPELLFSFLSQVESHNMNYLENQFQGFILAHESYKKSFLSEQNDFASNFIMDLQRYSATPFLLQLKLCRSVDQVQLNHHGHILDFDGSWDIYLSHWIFAISMEDAMQQGIALGKSNLMNIKKSASG